MNDFKPLLLIYSPDHGLLVIRLFNYNDREAISRYGGEELSGDLGAASFGLHNLSLGGDKILFGSVSKYHSLESFIGTACLGLFCESSREDPDTSAPGNANSYGPDRLGTVSKKPSPNANKGTSSTMSFILMRSKKAGWGTRVSWDSGLFVECCSWRTCTEPGRC